MTWMRTVLTANLHMSFVWDLEKNGKSDLAVKLRFSFEIWRC